MMDDNVSTKSSESSITTSGEYEIVTDSNVVTPIEQKLNDGDDDDDEVDPISGVVALGTRKSVCGVAGGGSIVGGAGSDKVSGSNGGGKQLNKSPTLDMANNRNISDIQHEMTDALRELELEHNDNYGGVGGGGGGDGGGRSEQSKDTAINANTTTTTTANTKPISAATTTTTKQIVATAAGTEPLTGSLSRQQKSLTLPLACTSSPALVVPDAEDDDDDLTDVTMRKAQTLQHPLKRQQQPLPKKMSPSPPGGVAAIEPNRVGHSVFYDCIDASPAGGGSAAGGGGGLEEKKDAMKPEKNDTDDEVSDIDQGCTIFSGVTYLGAANINAPKSETHIYRIMSELNSGTGTGTSQGLKISISIPNCSEGLVVLHDAESNTLIATYEIQSIILYYRGPVETPENGCFAFTWLHGESLFQCHVFRCHIPEAVNQVSACFQKAFQTYPPSMTCSMTSAIDSNMINSVTSDLSGNPINTAGYEFIVSLEIREKVAKNAFSAVPRDRNCFKLRAHTDKEVYITVKQVPSSTLPPLLIERCFGVLLSPGKLVRQADMQLIDMVTMGYQQPQSHMMPGGGGENVGAGGGVAGGGGGGAAGSGGGALSSGNGSANGGAVGGGVGGAATNASSAPITPLCLNPYYIRAEWKASEKAFEQLNVETAKTFLTVAVDIVMRGIQEPVRFVIETPVTIQSPGELRLMDHFISKRPMTLGFYLHLKRTTDEFSWEVSSIDPSEEIAEPPSQASAMSTSSTNFIKMGMSNLSRMVRSSSIVSFEDDCPSDNSSDGDEPLLSGTGEVSKDCSQDTLDEWDPILKEWDGEKRPKNLSALVRVGVPEALREKVWQKLANVEGKMEMHDMYKTLITKETKCETVIQRDIHRTFPAHKCFKETGGSGQDALFKVSKAYAVYDSEVGYCQGLSFIAASLLLHMPEEDAFCVLVSLMYDYGLRDLYKQGFEVLYLRLYQLDRLIKDHLPKLHEHFLACGIETHMYASQWFLTLFTARFPLCFVFHVLDVFLLDGVPLLFQVAVTLLSICEPDLRQLDFEGILKYFRVTLPKKCRSSSQARRVMKMACERKIKKLKQYEEEFLLKRQHKERLEKEAAVYEKRFGDERRKLQAEIDSLMQQLNTANERAIDKEKKHTGIIHDYKLIIQRLEHDMTTLNETLGNVMNIVAACKNCSQKIEHAGQQSQSHGQASSGDNQALTGGSGSSAGGGATLGPLDPLNVAGQRIRELELELAQAKLEKVQAECRNQDLNHQLCATINEMQTNRNSWQPWLSKTFNSIQEKVSTRGHRDAAATATFQSYTNQTGPGGVPLAASSGGSESETNSPSSNQEFKAFALGGSPKLPSKFQTTAKLRNSIDSLRNIVAPLDAPAQPPAAFKGLQQQQSQF